MRGNKKVIEGLNGLLSWELAAVDQYFIHSRMYQDWGLSKLYQRTDHEIDDEKGHASALIERILFLEGTPDVVTRVEINVGQDVRQMLQNDLNVELAVNKEIKAVIKLCEEKQDYQSRAMLQQLLEDTEMDHTYWLEQQLGLIEKMGLANYIQSQT